MWVTGHVFCMLPLLLLCVLAGLGFCFARIVKCTIILYCPYHLSFCIHGRELLLISSIILHSPIWTLTPILDSNHLKLDHLEFSMGAF